MLLFLVYFLFTPLGRHGFIEILLTQGEKVDQQVLRNLDGTFCMAKRLLVAMKLGEQCAHSGCNYKWKTTEISKVANRLKKH